MERNGKPVILVVDDDKNTRDGLQRALQRHYTVLTAEGADAALSLLDSGRQVDLLLSDLRMPGTDGLGLLRRVMAQYPRTVCILLTAYGSVETAVDAMKQGAYDFLTKPVNLDHLDMLVARALKSRDLEHRVETLESQLNEKFGMEHIVGESDAMKQVFDIIRQTAPTQASILIQGPSGTGKELVAQAIHRLSLRAKGRLWRCTARHSPRRCWRASCSATRRGLSPGPPFNARDALNWRMAARSFWMRFPRSIPPSRLSSCACWRSARSSGWAAKRRSRSISA
jgi:DNA-binding NtrC family response regulator